MGRLEKLVRKARQAGASLPFHDFQTMLELMGWELDRQRGSHRIYLHPVVLVPLSVQHRRDCTAVKYQVKQALGYAEEYGMLEGDEDG
jgi:predicted RNA binding protein YcfA (HicA-like mRNA interferase family)